MFVCHVCHLNPIDLTVIALVTDDWCGKILMMCCFQC